MLQKFSLRHFTVWFDCGLFAEKDELFDDHCEVLQFPS